MEEQIKSLQQHFNNLQPPIQQVNIAEADEDYSLSNPNTRPSQIQACIDAFDEDLEDRLEEIINTCITTVPTKDYWFLDFGASLHVTGNLQFVTGNLQSISK